MKQPSPLTTAYIGIGGNLGDALATVNAAIARLATLPHSSLDAQSRRYRSAPIDADGDDYVNAVVELNTTLTASDLLAALHQLEQDHGRLRPYRNAPRTLDLDLLLYGQHIIAEAGLSVPHLRMTQRAFVLLPLLEIAPAMVIPGLGPAQAWRAAVASQVITILPD